MKKNYSYTYLLPLLAEQVYFNKDILKCIINTYMIIDNPNYIKGDYIGILCNFDHSNRKFDELENRFVSTDLLINTHDVDKKNVLYVFAFPKEYTREYYSFMNGKYSEFGIDAKKIILRFWTTLYGNIPSFVLGTLLKIKQVLFKDKKLREKLIENLSSEKVPISLPEDIELGEHIDLINETYTFDHKNYITLDNIKDIF